MLSVVSMLGLATLSFYNGNMVSFQQQFAYSLSNDTNRIQEKFVIENAIYHTNTQSFNVTLTNVGNIPINISQLMLNSNPVIYSVSQGNSQSSSCTPSSNLIQYDSSANTAQRSVSSVTLSHTVGSGSNGLLLVGISWKISGNSPTVTQVTYAGNTMTRIADASTSATHVSIYGLLAPQSGSNNVAVSFSGRASGVTVGTLSVFGADQSGLPSNAQTNTGSPSGTASVTITPQNSNSWIFEVVSAYSNPTISASSGQTTLWSRGDPSSQIGGAGGYKNTVSQGQQLTESWSLNPSHSWSIAALEIKVAGSSGGCGNSGGGGGSIQFDSSANTSADNPNSVTLSHTVGTGTNGLLLVGVSWNIQSGDATVTQVTYAGQTMTLIADVTGSTGTTHTSIYGLLAPKSGTNNVVVSLNDNTSPAVIVGSLSVFGADQSGLPSNFQTNTGSPSGTASVTITPQNSNSWIFEVASLYSNPTATVNSGQTQIWNVGDISQSLGSVGAYQTNAPQGQQLTESWSLNPSHSWSMAAIEIKAASQSSGGSQSGGTQSTYTHGGCLILPGQSCTVAITYHCPIDPVTISVTTTRGKSASTMIAPLDPWYSSQWQFRKELTINYSKIASTLNNFTALVNFTDPNLKASAQSNGNDILFTSCDKVTKLNHEIEGYSSSMGALTAWVKIPTLYNSPNNIIYMYYGNSASPNQQNPQGAWDANYTGVWHMNQNPTNPIPSMKDSTSNQNHLTATNFVSTDQVPGQINGSLNFGGNGRYLSNTSPPNNMPLVQNKQTGSVWFKLTSSPSGVYNIYSLEDGNGAGIQMGFRNSNQMNIWQYGGSSLISVLLPSVNQWHYAVYTFDGTTHSLYIDGQLAGTKTISPQNSQTTSFYVGTYDCGGCENYLGQLDEIRYSNMARSAGWISTEYSNQIHTASFITVGTQESYLDPRVVK